MHQSRVIRHSLAALLLGISASLALAGDAAGKQKEVERLKSDTEHLTSQASNYKSIAESGTPEVKAAAEAVITAIQARIAASEKLTTALAGTDEKAIHDARDEVNKAGDQIRRKMEQTEVRKALARYASMEPMLAGAAEADKPLADALKAAIGKLKEAGDAYFAVVADKPWPEVDASRESWIEAMDNVDVAQRALAYANDRSRMTAKLDFSNADVKAKLAAAVKTEEEAIAAYRLSKEKARLANQLDRKRQMQMRELLAAPAPAKPAEKQ